jgi:anthranilate phosphoribosyltransferase
VTSHSLLPDPSTPLSRESARQAFADILDARASEEDIGAFLLALSDREETSLEIAEAARSLRERMVPIGAPPGAIDVCGTGGDGSG